MLTDATKEPTTPAIPAVASSAVLTVTATSAQAAGYLTVWPCDQPRPNASNLNYATGTTIANTVLTNLAADDTTCIYNQWPTDLIVDTNGYTRPNSTFATVVPGRLLETRTGPGLATIDGDQNGIGARPAATITVVKIAGRAGIPAGASSAVLTVTATSAQAAGYLTVWPCDQPRPNASNLNYATGTTIANTVLTNLAADDTTCIYNQSPTDLIVDTNGYD